MLMMTITNSFCVSCYVKYLRNLSLSASTREKKKKKEIYMQLK